MHCFDKAYGLSMEAVIIRKGFLISKSYSAALCAEALSSFVILTNRVLSLTITPPLTAGQGPATRIQAAAEALTASDPTA